MTTLNFTLVDDLVVDLYAVTQSFPDSERYGLQSQLRRASVSVPTNIVEGSVRRSDKAYLTYLETALGSASEVRYLLGLAVRLDFLKASEVAVLEHGYTEAVKALQKLITTIEASCHAQRQRLKLERRKRKANR